MMFLATKLIFGDDCRVLKFRAVSLQNSDDGEWPGSVDRDSAGIVQALPWPAVQQEDLHEALRHAAWTLVTEGQRAWDAGLFGEAADILMQVYELGWAYKWPDVLRAIAVNLMQALAATKQGALAAQVGRRLLESYASDGSEFSRPFSLLMLTGRALMDICNFAEAAPMFQQVIDDAEPGDAAMIRALFSRSLSQVNLGHLAAAQAGYRQALDLAEELPSPLWVAWALVGMSSVDLDQHRAPPRVLNDLLRAQSIAVEIHDPALYAAVRQDLGTYWMLTGRPVRAERLLTEVLAYQPKDSRSYAFALDELLQLYIRRNFWRKAGQIAAQMVAVWESSGDLMVRGLVMSRKAQILVGQGRRSEVGPLILNALEAFNTLGHRYAVRRVLEYCRCEALL